MKKIIFITSNDCVYCKKARNLLNRIKTSKPQSLDYVEIVDTDEAKEKNLAYDKLPCFYLGNEKVHEGYITMDRLIEMLEAAKNGESLNFTCEH